MKQKIRLTIMAVIVLLALPAFSTPAAFAADPKVSDGYDGEGGESIVNTETDAAPAQAEIEEKSFAAIIGQLVFYTGIILVLIYGLIKFLAIRQKNFQPNQAVQLMGGTPLGNNKSLQLVKVGQQIYLIGVGNEVTLIKEFSAEEDIHGIEKNLEVQTALVPKSVSSFIKEQIGKRTDSKAEDRTAGFENLFKQSLEKQKRKQERLEGDLNAWDSDKEGRSS